MTPETRAERLAEIDRLSTKLSAINDADVRGALVAKIESLKASIPPEEVVEEVPVEDLTPPSPAELEKADVFVRQARVEKMRGNAARATELLKEAAQTAPNSPALHEALGDDLMERRQIKAAKDAYARAIKLDPKNVGLERKYAEIVLRTATLGSLEDQMRANLSDSPFLTSEDTLANAGWVTFLSLFVPGSGHLVLGRTVAGIVIMVSWIAMIFWIFLMQKDVLGLLAMVGIRPSNGASKPGSLTVLFPIFVAAALHLTAIFQCAALAKGKSRGGRSVSRPLPPVDMKFD
jgi:tetratricopeptide (TPR) repeat protein